MKKTTLKDRREPHERLSELQYHVACGMVDGLSNTEIGARLSIHRTTVVRYITRIQNRADLDRSNIAAYAKKHKVFGK